MKTSHLLVLIGLLAANARAQDLLWPELARRPELWPAQCTVKETMQFDGGATVQAGQKLKVLQVMANEAQLTTLDDKITFTAEPGECDVLAVARAAYAQLTPKQRALTYDALVRQKELWPASITLTKGFDLGGGRSVRTGDPLKLMDFEPGKLLVVVEPLKMTMHVTPQVTDVMARARQLVEDENAAPRFIAQQQATQPKQPAVIAQQQSVDAVIAELDGKLVNSVTGKPQPLPADPLPRYVVFYRGSSTCPITRQFTPSLIKYYQAMKPAHPEVEFVWIMTESVEDTAKFAKQLGFSWRAIEYESTGSMPHVNGPITGLLPQLIVMDRSGRILANGSQHAAQNALRQLDALLKMPARQL